MALNSRPERGEELFDNWPGRQGTLRLASSTLPNPLSTSLTLLPNNQLIQTVPGENGADIWLLVQMPRGTFTGTVSLAGLERPVPLRGVLHRSTGTGVGYFLTPTSSGIVTIKP